MALSYGATSYGEVESVDGLYDTSQVHFTVRYTDSCPFEDGWTFQLFIDADDNAQTGYALGFDLLVRGVEFADTSHVYLREATRGDGPGGWGQQIDTVQLWMADGDRQLEFVIPLSEEGLADGAFRYMLESYRQGRLAGPPRAGYTKASGGEDPDLCPEDPNKTAPGLCGCGVPDDDSDGDGVADCLEWTRCQTSATAWQNRPIEPQTGTSCVLFDATPLAASIDGLIGLSCGETRTFSDSAVIVRFNLDGYIDAWTPEAINPWNPETPGWYAADHVIPYTAGMEYRFRLEIDIPQHTYSVYVTPQNSTEQRIALDYGFRIPNNGVTTLDHWAIWAGTGAERICAFTVCDRGSLTLSSWPELLACMTGPIESHDRSLKLNLRVCDQAMDLDDDGDLDLFDISRWLICHVGAR